MYSMFKNMWETLDAINYILLYNYICTYIWNGNYYLSYNKSYKLNIATCVCISLFNENQNIFARCDLMDRRLELTIINMHHDRSDSCRSNARVLPVNA